LLIHCSIIIFRVWVFDNLPVDYSWWFIELMISVDSIFPENFQEFCAQTSLTFVVVAAKNLNYCPLILSCFLQLESNHLQIIKWWQSKSCHNSKLQQQEQLWPFLHPLLNEIEQSRSFAFFLVATHPTAVLCSLIIFKQFAFMFLIALRW